MSDSTVFLLVENMRPRFHFSLLLQNSYHMYNAPSYRQNVSGIYMLHYQVHQVVSKASANPPHSRNNANEKAPKTLCAGLKFSNHTAKA